jgi:hypothetical protein
MGFLSLQHMRIRRSTTRGFCLPATFRPQGLATLSTASSLRIPAGFVSHRRRSWDSPSEYSPLERYLRVSAQKHPPTVSPSPCSRRGPTGRWTRPRFLGFDPPESPWPVLALLARDTLDTPLGFTLLGHSHEDLAGDFAPAPLMHLAAHPTRHATRVSECQSIFASPPTRRRGPVRERQPF